MSSDIDDVIAKLLPLFRDVFEDDDLTISASTTAQDVDGWDSLSHIRLMLAIEKSFRLRFSAAEVSGLENVGAMARLIIKKQAAK